MITLRLRYKDIVNVNINGNFRNPIDTIQFLSQDVMCFLKQGKLGERQKAETHSVWEHYVSVSMNRSLVICVHPPDRPPRHPPAPFYFLFLSHAALRADWQHVWEASSRSARW